MQVELGFFQLVDVFHEIGFVAMKDDMVAEQKIERSARGGDEQVLFQTRSHGTGSLRRRLWMDTAKILSSLGRTVKSKRGRVCRPGAGVF
jgi:hypothetical protein